MEQNLQTKTTEEVTKTSKLTKHDVFRSWLSWWLFAAASTSMERLQALSCCAAMSIVLEKLYTTKEELSAALKRHLMFFNTQAIWGSIIHGTVIAMEEQRAEGADIPDEMITGLKTGLMGPMSGIGDTIDWCTLDPILLVLFIPLAETGNWLGAVLPLFLFTIPTVLNSYYLWHLGYRVGRESISSLLGSGKVKQLISGASVLGLFMMGAISGSYVKITTPLVITTSTQTFAVQELIFDGLFPGFLSLLAILGVYTYLHKVGPKYTRAMLGLVVIGMVLGGFGIL